LIPHPRRLGSKNSGLKLFRRLPRGLVLTEEAQRYLPALRAASTRRPQSCSPGAPAAR
jgi:hypothetical protein